MPGNTVQLVWIGQSNEATSFAAVHLQIYNRNSTSWEDLDSNNTTAAATDITLNGNVADLTNYKDTHGLIACRVYQLDV